MKKREELERLNEMSDDDLREEAARLKESLFRLNFKLALGDMDAVKTVRRERKSIARIQTLMRRRAGEQQAAAASGK
ncbi:MAG TPA: 50S ribosomal protein L29 [Pyrinomonadaceae bacterium]|jgi:ribosomal protein L29|nr:50S ribosomal protein L29 [Pyrinomonadaceae bacterium]